MAALSHETIKRLRAVYLELTCILGEIDADSPHVGGMRSTEGYDFMENHPPAAFIDIAKTNISRAINYRRESPQ